MIPSPEAIITEIETGPLAADLAPLWATRFEAPARAKPTPQNARDAAELATVPARASAWSAKSHRAGRLHPDAAHEIHRRLTTAPAGVPSRAEVLGWTGFDRKAIQRAQWSLRP